MIPLRPYQEAARVAIRRHWALDAKRPVDDRRGALAVLPTGTGKTMLALSQAVAAAERGRRVLWLAHTDELVSQPLESLRGVAPTVAKSAGIVQADRDDATARVVFASVATVRNPARLARVLAAGIPSLVVVDEAHHSAAQSYRDILAAVDAAADAAGEPRPLRLGLTATPERADGAALHGLWRTVATYSIARAIEDRYLVPWRQVVRRLPDLDLSAITPDGDGDFDPASQGRALLAAHVVEHTVDVVRREAADRLTMVFCVTVSQAEETAKALTAAGVVAAVVSEATPKRTRREIVRQFAAGKIRALCNVRALTEGTDIPPVSCVVIAALTRSKYLYVQMVGRGLRPSARTNKTDLLIVDIAGASQEHDLMQAPCLVEDGDAPGGEDLPVGAVALAAVGLTLAPDGRRVVVHAVRQGTPASWAGIHPQDQLVTLGGEVVRSVGCAVAALRAHQGRTLDVMVDRGGRRLGLDLDVPHWAMDRDLLAGLRSNRSRAKYSWVRVPGLAEEVWALECGGAGAVVVVEAGDDRWRVWRLPAPAAAEPGQRRKRQPPEALVDGPVRYELAQGLGEDVARRAGATGLIYRGAAWMAEAPTERQVAALARFGLERSPSGDYLGAEGPIRSAGEAAAQLTREILMREVARLKLATRTAPSRKKEARCA